MKSVFGISFSGVPETLACFVLYLAIYVRKLLKKEALKIFICIFAA